MWSFTRVTKHWGKGNPQTLGVLLDTGSELTLIPLEPESYSGSSVRVGPNDGGQECGGQMEMKR